MTKTLTANQASTRFYFAISIILLLVAVVYVVGSVFSERELRFGSCTLRTDVAKTDAQKARGLSGRATIPPDYAMTFPFRHEKPPFWMKDMLVPIDIVWVTGNRVVKVDLSVPVDDGAVYYTPPTEIDWVVETAAGRAADCGVNVNTRLQGLTS